MNADNLPNADQVESGGGTGKHFPDSNMFTHEAIGQQMLNTSAITDQVGREIYFGEQPRKADNYITYFPVPGLPLLLRGQISTERWQLSVRSKTPQGVYQTALTVMQTWEDFNNHIEKAVGNDGILDGGNAASTYTNTIDGGDASTTFSNKVEGSTDVFSMDRVNVRSMHMMKDPDADYFHIPIDIFITYYSSEQDD